ncbi:hypothetical protein GGF43_005589, partial [Coemansia sp. RSA 2618]
MSLKFQKLKKAGQLPSSKSSGPAKVNCVENRASLFSRLFFTWVTPLIVHGWSTPVQPESLPEIGMGDEMDPSAIATKFQAEWAKEVRRAQSPMTELIPVFIPILVKLTTTFAQHKRQAANQALKAGANASSPGSSHAAVLNPPVWQGYVLVAAMFALLLLYSWSFQWFFYEVGKATVIVRTALVSAIYRKSLVLSAQARSRLTLGKLTNLISSDISQVERGVTNIIVCVTIPIQVIVSIVVLIYMIGPTGAVGWALVIAFVPMQMWVSRYLVRLRGKA